MSVKIKTDEEMRHLGGEVLRELEDGVNVVELIGDVGAGKTTLVKGMAQEMGVKEAVTSPSFTLKKIYEGKDGRKLAHYDFYRLNEAGVMADELTETVTEPGMVTVVEWAETVKDVLPKKRVRIIIRYTDDGGREVEVVK